MNKNLTFVKILTVLTAALSVGIGRSEASGEKCQRIVLANGVARHQRQGRLLRFRCHKGYEFVGRRYMNCFRGQWDFQRDPSVSYPMCVKPGCRASSYINGHFLETYKGAVVSVVCNLGYSLIGSPTVYCNGVTWNQKFPECKATNQTPSKKCDFQQDLCGWTQEPHGDWLWYNDSLPEGRSPHNSSNPERYMLLGNSSSLVMNATERMYSPVFPSNYSEDSCFTFRYRMHGSTTGHLKVYFKPEGEEFYNTIPPFWLNGEQGYDWRQGYFPIFPSEEPFQIIIEGASHAGGNTVTAFDDVALLSGTDCDRLRDQFSTTAAFTSGSVESTTEDDEDTWSCRNRCEQDAVVPDTNLTAGDLQEKPKCDCHVRCEWTHSCCLDFLQYCRELVTTTTMLSTMSTEVTTEETSEETTLTTAITTTLTVPQTNTTHQQTRQRSRATTVPIKTTTLLPAGGGGFHYNIFRPIFGPKETKTTTTTATTASATMKAEHVNPSKSLWPRYRLGVLKDEGGGSHPQRVVRPEKGQASSGIPAEAMGAVAAVSFIVICAAVAIAVVRRRRRRKSERESMVEDSDSICFGMNPIYESLTSPSTPACHGLECGPVGSSSGAEDGSSNH